MNHRESSNGPPLLSRTRQLIADLRSRLGQADPMPVVEPISEIPPPPARLFPSVGRRMSHSRQASEHTTALLGIGHVGTRYPTDVVLQFQAELAVAYQAVSTVLQLEWIVKHGYLPVKSRITSHREYLLRPDLGRRLDEESLHLLREKAEKGIDVQPILADGLSAIACQGAGPELLRAFMDACTARGLSVGTPVGARFARVWLEDEIGQETQAKVAAILLGERPGLGTGDGLSAYLVYNPRIGNTDGNRNMMSNIHARGTLPSEAAHRLGALAAAMIAQKTSGVSLDLGPLTAELGRDVIGTAYRAPQVRVRLVEVPS